MTYHVSEVVLLLVNKDRAIKSTFNIPSILINMKNLIFDTRFYMVLFYELIKRE